MEKRVSAPGSRCCYGPLELPSLPASPHHGAPSVIDISPRPSASGSSQGIQSPGIQSPTNGYGVYGPKPATNQMISACPPPACEMYGVFTDAHGNQKIVSSAAPGSPVPDFTNQDQRKQVLYGWCIIAKPAPSSPSYGYLEQPVQNVQPVAQNVQAVNMQQQHSYWPWAPAQNAHAYHPMGDVNMQQQQPFHWVPTQNEHNNVMNNPNMQHPFQWVPAHQNVHTHHADNTNVQQQFYQAPPAAQNVHTHVNNTNLQQQQQSHYATAPTAQTCANTHNTQ